jgi:hypothetical protein
MTATDSSGETRPDGTSDAGGTGRWQARRVGEHGTAGPIVVSAVLNDRPVIVTAGDDGAVQCWELTPDGLTWMAKWIPRFSEVPPEAAATKGATKQQTSGAVEIEESPMPTALAVSSRPGRSVVLVGFRDGSVGTIDLTQVAGIEKLPFTHVGPVTAIVVFTEDGGRTRVVSAGGDVLTWVDHPLPPNESPTELYSRTSDQRGWSLAVSDDGPLQHVYAGTSDVVFHWAFGRKDDATSIVRQGNITLSSAQQSRRIVCVVVAPDGDLMLATNFDGIDTVDITTEKPGRRLNPDVGEITALQAVVVDGRPAVAIGSALGQVAVMDPATGEHLGPAADVGEAVSDLGALPQDGGDVILVGTTDGGIHVIETGAPPMLDKVELQDDLPARTQREDRLRRSPLAAALAVRLKRRHEEKREASFLVHLDGRWGSGKTTVLNFVAAELGEGWTIVHYNAWRQARVGPPWWTLLTALRDEMMRRRSPPGRAFLWLREIFNQRIRRASGLPATILLVLAAVAVFVLVRPEDTDVGDTLTTVQGVAAALTAIATLFAGAQLVARFFGWHSPRGAKAFEDLDTNPMDRVAGHFAWLVKTEQRPIAYFVDDIDRCPANHVVDLLEAVQTLVRDAAGSTKDALSPCFVVAGDGAWIRNAFEEHYRDFAIPIAEPGRPLGYLFLAKIFQLTVPVPRIGPVRQSQYFRELLGLHDDGTPKDDTVAKARRQVEAAPNDDAQQQVLARLPQGVREVVAPVAVRRQTERSFAEATEHRLAGFAPLLPDNPRAVKRFLNAFALTRSVRTVEGQAIPTGTLALWTILETRWPLLADYLAAHPKCVTAAADDPRLPETIRLLMEDDEVKVVLGFPDGGPLTPHLVIACRGG